MPIYRRLCSIARVRYVATNLIHKCTEHFTQLIDRRHRKERYNQSYSAAAGMMLHQIWHS